MRLRIKFLLLLLILIAVFFLKAIPADIARQQPGSILKFGVLFSGSRHSELEPCGCKGKKQLGGVDREAYYFKQLELAKDLPFLRVDAGGWTDSSLTENEKLKTTFLLRALGRLKFDAVNVGFPDLGLGLAQVQELAEKNNLTLISANIVEKSTLSPIFLPYLIGEINAQGTRVKVGILGISGRKEPPPQLRGAEIAQKEKPQPLSTLKPLPTPHPTVVVAPQPIVAPRAEIREFYFDYQYPGWHYFQQGPGAFKRILSPAPTPIVFPRFPLSPMPGLIEAETPYSPAPPVMPEKETEYLPPLPKKETEYESSLPGYPFNDELKLAAKGDGEEASLPPGMAEKKPEPGKKVGRDFIILPPEEALQKFLPLISQKADVIILLAYMTLREVEELAKRFPEIDIIIAGRFSFPERFEQQFKEFEGRKIGQAAVLSTSCNGEKLGKLVITLNARKKVADISGSAVNLTVEAPKDPELMKLLAEYKAETARLHKPAPPAQPRAITFAGAYSCRDCHRQQYEEWEKTRHAKAMSSLVNKQQQFNPDCLSCHTTGYKKDNGFVDLRTTPRFASVQCESCHGPGYAHIVEARRLLMLKGRPPAPAPSKEGEMAGSPKVLPARAVPPPVCQSCHNPDRDPDFNYHQDILSVQH